MRRTGFTILQLMITTMIVGLVTTLTLPRLIDAVYKTNVRSARVAFANLVARARTVAVQRGCVATLRVTTGPAGAVWVTACNINQAGTDTVGRVEPLATRFGVSLSATITSLQFQPHGLSVGYQPMTVVFTSIASGVPYTDSTVINELGKVVH
ncbi:MAG TPA: GspH/FimT family pseudopilin [Gemmatimonadales bacterium]|nr:GspH/FimT family pseudopilin [Gemmatimonadales bacterium]